METLMKNQAHITIPTTSPELQNLWTELSDEVAELTCGGAGLSGWIRDVMEKAGFKTRTTPCCGDGFVEEDQPGG